MSEEIKTLDDVIKVCDKILENKPKDKRMMNLHYKTVDELTKDKIRLEIAYLQGQQDYILQSPYIPREIKEKQLQRLKLEMDSLTIRLLC